MNEFFENARDGFVFAGVPCFIALTLLSYYRGRISYGIKLAVGCLSISPLFGWIGCLPIFFFAIWKLFNDKLDHTNFSEVGDKNYIQELTELGKLKEDGILTEKEFNTKKEEILNKKVA